MKKIITIASASLLTACASHSDEIASQYTSPMMYSGFTCNQISMEMASISRRASSLGGQIDEKANGDAWQTGIGIALFWPALFFIDGDGANAQEYGRLKGEMEALEKAAIQKDCTVDMAEIIPPKQKKENQNNNKEAIPKPQRN